MKYQPRSMAMSLRARHMSESDRNQIQLEILGLCEALFTYSNEHGMCEMQSDFHFYYDLKKGNVFKVSEIDVIEPKMEHPEKGEYRIALKSEIKANENEFY